MILDIAAIGDFHLDKLSDLIPNHLDLQFATLDKIMRQIKDKGIKHVVLLGDVFDTINPSDEVAIRFHNWILKHKSIQFDWVVGNHDATSLDKCRVDLAKETWAASLSGQLRIHRQPTIIDKHIGFLPYPHKQPLKGVSVNFAHVDRPGAMRDNGSKTRTTGEWDEKANFVIGHIHTAQSIKLTHYPGAPFQLSFGEQGEKFWAHIRVNTKLKKVKFIPVLIHPEYRLHNLVISKVEDLELLPEAPDYCKLWVEPGVTIPKRLLMEKPNCVMATQGTNVSKDLADIINKMENVVPVIDVKYGLSDYLQTKHNLTDKQMKIANRLVDEARAS